MKINLMYVGKTDDDYIKNGCLLYYNRLKRYLPIEEIIVPSVKNIKSLRIEEVKEREAELILKQLKPADRLILLDEKGKQFDSVGFSKYIEQNMVDRIKNLIFLVGGPYGFSKNIYDRANGKISLSNLTFSHQMVRLFFMEQLYRAFTIIRNEPYHHG